jgi:hypothetical protein
MYLAYFLRDCVNKTLKQTTKHSEIERRKMHRSKSNEVGPGATAKAVPIDLLENSYDTKSQNHETKHTRPKGSKDPFPNDLRQENKQRKR